MTRPLAIIIPVYNEAANFADLWAEICGKIKSDFVAYVVYDCDEDDTVPVAQAIINRGERRLILVKNIFGKGVVGAVRSGFSQVSEGPCLVVMADLCDDLAQVDKMLELYEHGFHVVVGSRYMPGGRLVGGPWLKQTLSRAAGVSLKWLRGFPTHDATNAFKIYDARMVKAMTIESKGGFELNLELTVKAFLAGYCMTEVPSTWRDRRRGRSRFRLFAWLPHYIKWYLYAFRPRKAVI